MRATSRRTRQGGSRLFDLDEGWPVVVSCGTFGDHRAMTIADVELARIGSVLDTWDHRDAVVSPVERLRGPAEVNNAHFEALQPIIGITIKLGVGPTPGSDREADAEWAASSALARRDVLANQTAGIDHGLAAGSLGLLERIDALAGTHNDHDWEQLVRQRVTEGVDARKQGRQRGRELRRLRESDPQSEPWEPLPAGWPLRHPTDYWLRQAAPTITDAACRSLLQAQIKLLTRAYQQLRDLDWAVEEAAADVVCEVHVIDAPRGASEQSVRAVVIAAAKGGVPVDHQIKLRVVKDPTGPYNGKLVSMLVGERWLICAHQLKDNSLLPLDGTRRYAATTP
jgi:hypothetical protein